MRLRGTSATLALAAALLAAAPAAAEPQPAAISPAPAATEATPPATHVTAAADLRRRHHHAKGDPLEGFNRAMFSVHQFLDRIAFRPLAMLYKTVVPKPVRTGIRHIFSNVGEPLVFANDVLQLKPRRAVKTVGRFLVNSTIGIGGILDVARTDRFKLPHHDNSFGDTLGHYGVHPGFYIFLPLVGPSDLRDFGAGIAQGQTYAFTIGTPFDRAEYRVSEAVLTGLDLRVESDGALKALLGSAVDPYATLRSAYLQDRAVEIAETHDGAKARAASPLDDPLTDPGAGAGAAPAAAPKAGASPLDDPLADPASGPTVPPPASALTPGKITDTMPADPAPPAPSMPPPPPPKP